jgi:3-dehydroquinate dehydratase-1
VVVSLQDLPPIEKIEAAYQTGLLDMVELRMDLQPSWESAHRFAEGLRLRGIPVLATIRSRAEGGSWYGSEAERLTSFRALIPHVSAVDIELSSEAIRRDVMEAARGAGKGVILSYHHFQETPPSNVLDRIAIQAQSLGADILKVAVWAECQEDIRRLARFTLAHADQNRVTIAMGPQGILSRIFFPVLGSLLTYASWGMPTAPGQMDAVETAAWLARFYPDRGTVTRVVT